MLTSNEGVAALSSIRSELEVDASHDFPKRTLRELLVLYDVCKAFGFDMAHTEQVLGSNGLACVQNYLNVTFSK